MTFAKSVSSWKTFCQVTLHKLAYSCNTTQEQINIGASLQCNMRPKSCVWPHHRGNYSVKLKNIEQIDCFILQILNNSTTFLEISQEDGHLSSLLWNVRLQLAAS